VIPFLYLHSEMVSLYRNLYVENRADALEALDSLPQIKHAHSLKGKILFSMVFGNYPSGI